RRVAGHLPGALRPDTGGHVPPDAGGRRRLGERGAARGRAVAYARDGRRRMARRKSAVGRVAAGRRGAAPDTGSPAAPRPPSTGLASSAGLTPGTTAPR